MMKHLVVLWGGSGGGAEPIERRDYWVDPVSADAIVRYLHARRTPFMQIRYAPKGLMVARRDVNQLAMKSAAAAVLYVGAPTAILRIIVSPETRDRMRDLRVAYVAADWRVGHVVENARRHVRSDSSPWTPVASHLTFADLSDDANLNENRQVIETLHEGDVHLPTILLVGDLIPAFAAVVDPYENQRRDLRQWCDGERDEDADLSDADRDAMHMEDSLETEPGDAGAGGGGDGGNRRGHPQPSNFPMDFPAPPPLRACCGSDATPRQVEDYIAERMAEAVIPACPPRYPLVLGPGRIGLINQTGIQCYVNSVVQCLAHTPLFKQFFVRNQYRIGLNTDNPLGSGGHLAVKFGELVEDLWRCAYVPASSMALHNESGKFRDQFAEQQQQDAQEFLAALLDGVHEDYNEVTKRIMVPKFVPQDDAGIRVEEVAEECWRRYLLRNQSFLVQHCMGMLKSSLQCKVCGKGDLTFDAYNVLSLELPDSEPKEMVSWLYFPATYPQTKAVLLQRHLPSFVTLSQLKAEVYKTSGKDPKAFKSIWTHVIYEPKRIAVTVEPFFQPLSDELTLSQLSLGNHTHAFREPRGRYRWLALFETRKAPGEGDVPQVPIVVNTFETTRLNATLQPLVLLMDEERVTAQNVMQEVYGRLGVRTGTAVAPTRTPVPGGSPQPRHVDPRGEDEPARDAGDGGSDLLMPSDTDDPAPAPPPGSGSATPPPARVCTAAPGGNGNGTCGDDDAAPSPTTPSSTAHINLTRTGAAVNTRGEGGGYGAPAAAATPAGDDKAFADSLRCVGDALSFDSMHLELRGAGWDETQDNFACFLCGLQCAGCRVWPMLPRRKLRKRERCPPQPVIVVRDDGSQSDPVMIYRRLMEVEWIQEAVVVYCGGDMNEANWLVAADALSDDERASATIASAFAELDEELRMVIPDGWKDMSLADIALAISRGKIKRILSERLIEGFVSDVHGMDERDIGGLPFRDFVEPEPESMGLYVGEYPVTMVASELPQVVADAVPDDWADMTIGELAMHLAERYIFKVCRYAPAGWAAVSAEERAEAARMEGDDVDDIHSDSDGNESEEAGAPIGFYDPLPLWRTAERERRDADFDRSRRHRSQYSPSPSSDDSRGGLWPRPLVLKLDFGAGKGATEADEATIQKRIPLNLRMQMRFAPTCAFDRDEYIKRIRAGASNDPGTILKQCAGYECDMKNSSHRRKSQERENKVYTLEQCMTLFTRVEKLDDDECWNCPRCTKRQPSKKKIEIWNLPNMLFVHIKRFACQGGVSTRLRHAVDFPLDDFDLSTYLARRGETAKTGSELMSPTTTTKDYFTPSPISTPLPATANPTALFLESPTPSQDATPWPREATGPAQSTGAPRTPQKPAPGASSSPPMPHSGKYTLLSIVAHHGPDIQYGHYTAHCYHDTLGKWYHFNDDIVTERTPEEMKRDMQRDVYLLVYVRKDYKDFSWREPCEWPDLSDVVARVEAENERERQKEREARALREAGQAPPQRREPARGNDGEMPDEPEPKRQRMPDGAPTPRRLDLRGTSMERSPLRQMPDTMIEPDP